MISLPSKFYTVSTVLFHKYGVVNAAVINCMSQFSISPPTMETRDISQGIGIILCRFPNWSIIDRAGPVYYCIGHPFNTISSSSLKFYIGFQKVTSEPIEHFVFFYPQGHSWRSPNQNQNNLDNIQMEFCQSQPSKKQ